MDHKHICYAGFGPRMHPRNFVFITVMTLCHLQLAGQVLTNALPPPQSAAGIVNAGQSPSVSQLPDDPGQEAIPYAKPEPIPPSGVPLRWDAKGEQTWKGDTATVSGDVVIYYRDYVIRADKIVYNRSTTELEAEGHLQVTGGPDDVDISASHGDMRLNMHTARFYDVTGSSGVRRTGRSEVYSTANPFLFSGRVLLQTGEGKYKIIDGTMTNCRLPKPDWVLISRQIKLENGEASTKNAVFKFLGMPLFYLPFLRHPTDVTGRESGLLIPVLPYNSSVKGWVMGEQYYWAISRSMDMVIGTDYFSKRGWAPSGDFRYKGPGLDHFTARWNALIDRGTQQLQTSGPQAGQTILVNQGGTDIFAAGRYDLSDKTHAAANVEYLSSYVYKLVFNDNYLQAVNSEVHSTASLTRAHDGLVPSAYLERLQNFASPTQGDEVRILHLPSLRFDVLDEPLHTSPFYWRMGSSISYLGRSESGFHVRNMGRFDLYPHLSLPIVGGGWSLIPEIALRETFYTGSQNPDLTGANGGTPTVSHDPLSRSDFEASVDVRPPGLERDFAMGNFKLRHVIEPELTYRFVGGIGVKAQNVPLIDPTDIATNTNEIGYAVTQRFYVRSTGSEPCATADAGTEASCLAQPREWASWTIAQKYFLNPTFGGAIIPGRRNVFDTTLDLTGISFLTDPRNLSPLVSRMRFEAVKNLRIEWDMDYDPKSGRLDADNVLAGYSLGPATFGVGHSLLNAVDEKGSAASLTQSQQLQPFLEIGKPNAEGFNLAANGGYDFVNRALQYAGVQAVYNWNCCGLSLGYRRFAFGSIRDETQYLYSFTLANFGSVGDIRRSTTVFHDPTQPPPY